MSDHEFNYLSLQGSSESLVKEKGSKFLGYSQPVLSEAEAETFLHSIKSLHPKARHHCYAWRIGHPDPMERSNDDGEPSGTAGRPILGQLIKADLTNAMVVVVRYFGGTLLGTSGLIQAYKACAEATLGSARIISIIEKETWNIEIDFAIVHLLEEWAPQLGLEIQERTHQGNRMNYKIIVAKSKAQNASLELKAKLLDLYPEEVEEKCDVYNTFRIDKQ